MSLVHGRDLLMPATVSMSQKDKGRSLHKYAARSKAGKAYQLGWKPKHVGLFDSIDAEYEAVIEEGKEQAPKVHFDEMYNLGLKFKET